MDIATAYTGLKFAKDSLTTIVKAKIDNETQLAINAVLEKLGQAQDVLFELRDVMANLQEENQQLKNELKENQVWLDKEAQYKLIKTTGGAVVYESTNPPVHYICPTCFEQKQIHILQDMRVMSGEYKCPKCEALYPINPSGPTSRVAIGRA